MAAITKKEWDDSLFSEKEALCWLAMDIRNISNKIFRELQSSGNKEITVSNKDLFMLKKLCETVLLQPVIEKCPME